MHGKCICQALPSRHFTKMLLHRRSGKEGDSPRTPPDLAILPATDRQTHKLQQRPTLGGGGGWGNKKGYLGNGQAKGHPSEQEEVAVQPVHQLVDAAVGVDEFAGLQVGEGLHPLAAHGVDH